MKLHELESMHFTQGIDGDMLNAASADTEIGEFIDDPAKYDTILIDGNEVGAISIRNNYIKSIFILPKYRGSGYGEKAIIQSGGNSAHVETNNTPSMRMFMKAGFKPMGEPIKDGDVYVQEFRK